MNPLTPPELALLEFLHRPPLIPPLKPQKFHRTFFQFILEYGWFYRPAPLPTGLKRGTDGECYNNALRLALDNPNLIYVEGFGDGGGGRRFHHAWVTDGQGRAIDSTWRKPAAVYAGVPFRTSFVALVGLKNKGVGGLIDDSLNHFPLLNELGDRPEEWLDLRGKGYRALT